MRYEYDAIEIDINYHARRTPWGDPEPYIQVTFMAGGKPIGKLDSLESHHCEIPAHGFVRVEMGKVMTAPNGDFLE